MGHILNDISDAKKSHKEVSCLLSNVCIHTCSLVLTCVICRLVHSTDVFSGLNSDWKSFSYLENEEDLVFVAEGRSWYVINLNNVKVISTVQYCMV